MIASLKNANAQWQLGKCTNQNAHSNITSNSREVQRARVLNQLTNNSKIKPRNQPLRGMQGYEFLKRAFTEANPNCSCSDYDKACHRFARMVGV